MPSSVALGAAKTESKSAKKMHDIVYRSTRVSSGYGYFFLEQMRTFIPLVSAVNPHDNVAPLEIHGFRADYEHRAHECHFRMDVILDVDEIVSSCYVSYSPRQEIVGKDDGLQSTDRKNRGIVSVAHRAVWNTHCPHEGHGRRALRSNPGRAAFERG
jgi:hypothetical protein